MKVRYIGETFGVTGLTNNAVYECTEVDPLTGMLRIIDDGGVDDVESDYLAGYLYSARNPRPIDGSSDGGRWEIVEDDANGTLKQAIYG